MKLKMKLLIFFIFLTLSQGAMALSDFQMKIILWGVVASDSWGNQWPALTRLNSLSYRSGVDLQKTSGTAFLNVFCQKNNISQLMNFSAAENLESYGSIIVSAVKMQASNHDIKCGGIRSPYFFLMYQKTLHDFSRLNSSDKYFIDLYTKELINMIEQVQSELKNAVNTYSSLSEQVRIFRQFCMAHPYTQYCAASAKEAKRKKRLINISEEKIRQMVWTIGDMTRIISEKSGESISQEHIRSRP